MLKKWLLKFLGLENAYKRIVELERTIITQQEWLDRHESNLMILHKKITAAEFMSKKHYVRIKRLETK
tara:strand:- start:474 stop:677 length:204 start_codon:yes stop_codon:yes gene_type:complete